MSSSSSAAAAAAAAASTTQSTAASSEKASASCKYWSATLALMSSSSSAASAAASTTQSTAASSDKASALCKHCGKVGAEARCSACKEVFYCNQSHQKADWKQHKSCCKGVTAEPKSIWIEVGAGVGDGLHNPMMNHIFSNKHDGWKHVTQQPQFAQGNAIGPLRSPFSEFIGWSFEMYCSKVDNYMDGPSHVNGRGPMGGCGNKNSNGAARYLGSFVETGLSPYTTLSGRIWVTGRRQSDGKPLTSENLLGILSFIADAMDLFEDRELPVRPNLLRWAEAYKRGTWESCEGGCAGDFFCTDTERLRSNQKVIHGP
jgi:hypothetical protein